MSEICANNSNPTGGINDGQSGAFNQYMWGDLIVFTNLFNASANGGGAPTGVTACFDLPIDGGPANLPDNSGCYQNNGILQDAQGNDIACTISYTGGFTNTGAVRGYPAFLLGSREGTNETWGVPCGLVSAVQAGLRDTGSGTPGTTIYDMNTVQAATGYPAFANAVPANSKIVVDWEDCGDPAVYNVFSDTYWHDVSDTSLLPIDTAGNPITGLQNTINGISGKDTAMWNLNFWHYIPPGFNATGGVGGAPIASVTIEPGKPVDIYVKHETGGDNNFFYLAFVYQNTQFDHELDYNLYVDWVTSTATGPGTFLTDVYNHSASQTIATQMANPTNNALPKTLRPPDGGMVVDSLQIGTEMWGTTNGGNDVGEICFNKAGFRAGGEDFGKVNSTTTEPETGTASCTLAVVDTVTNMASCILAVVDGSEDCVCTDFPDSVGGVCGQNLLVEYTVPAGGVVTGATSTGDITGLTGIGQTSLTIVPGSCDDCMTGTVTVFYTLNGEDCSCVVPYSFVPDYVRLPVSNPVLDEIDNLLCEHCRTGDCPIHCEPHQTGFLWNSWCLQEGATLDTTGCLFDCDTVSSGTNACDCSYNQKWKFRGQGSYKITLPEAQPLGAVVIWGHNLWEGAEENDTHGTIEVLDGLSGQPIQPTNWDMSHATITANEPVVMYFDDTEYTCIEVRATGATDAVDGTCNESPHMIENIFIGECLDLPEGLRKFASPFNASEYEARIKSGCNGPLSRKLKRKPIDISLRLECLCYEWLRDTWRPFRDYLQTTPVYFVWSKNRYPDEVARVWLDDCIRPTEFTDSHFSAIDLPLKAQISQSK